MSNVDRANKLLQLLREGYDEQEPVQTLVVDALTDMRHLCDKQELSFFDCDRVAFSHYCREVHLQDKLDECGE